MHKICILHVNRRAQRGAWNRFKITGRDELRAGRGSSLGSWSDGSHALFLWWETERTEPTQKAPSKTVKPQPFSYKCKTCACTCQSNSVHITDSSPATTRPQLLDSLFWYRQMLNSLYVFKRPINIFHPFEHHFLASNATKRQQIQSNMHNKCLWRSPPSSTPVHCCTVSQH